MSVCLLRGVLRFVYACLSQAFNMNLVFPSHQVRGVGPGLGCMCVGVCVWVGWGVSYEVCFTGSQKSRLGSLSCVFVLIRSQTSEVAIYTTGTLNSCIVVSLYVLLPTAEKQKVGIHFVAFVCLLSKYVISHRANFKEAF